MLGLAFNVLATRWLNFPSIFSIGRLFVQGGNVYIFFSTSAVRRRTALWKIHTIIWLMNMHITQISCISERRYHNKLKNMSRISLSMVRLRTLIISAQLTWTPRMDLNLQPFTCNIMYKKQNNNECQICSNVTPTKT